MKQNDLAPGFIGKLADGRLCHYRADQNAVYELEETTSLPVGAWLAGYGDETVEIRPAREGPDGKMIPAVVARPRKRILDLAWAMSRSWRETEKDWGELTESEFRQLLPIGKCWEDLSGKLGDAFADSFLLERDGTRPSQASPESTSAAAPAPAPTGDAENSRASSSSD